MASAAAQQMFNSLSPAEQARVTASIAGNPSGLDDWYANAAKAGDPRAIRAGGAGQSEDFARFNEGTLTGWAQGFYDEAASRAAGRPQFRSMRGAEGFFDKPTECPPGMGPSGPNESDPCTTKGYSEPAGGATMAPGGATGAGGVSGGPNWSQYANNPLAGLLMSQGGIAGQAQQGGALAGGGTWWSRNAPARAAEAKGGVGNNALSGPAGGTGSSNPFVGMQPGVPQNISEPRANTGGILPTQPGQYGGINPGGGASALSSMLTPLQNQAAPVSPLTSTLTPLMGQVRRRDPLTNALGPAQQAGGWF